MEKGNRMAAETERTESEKLIATERLGWQPRDPSSSSPDSCSSSASGRKDRERQRSRERGRQSDRKIDGGDFRISSFSLLFDSDAEAGLMRSATRRGGWAEIKR